MIELLLMGNDMICVYASAVVVTLDYSVHPLDCDKYITVVRGLTQVVSTLHNKLLLMCSPAQYLLDSDPCHMLMVIVCTDHQLEDFLRITLDINIARQAVHHQLMSSIRPSLITKVNTIMYDQPTPISHHCPGLNPIEPAIGA